MTRYCRRCHVWWVGAPPCWACDRPGDDVRGDWQIVPARSWRNPATWTPDEEEGAA